MVVLVGVKAAVRLSIDWFLSRTEFRIGKSLVEALLLSIILSPVMWSQSALPKGGPPAPENVVRITVAAMTVSPVEGQPAKPHWILVRPPTESDVFITDTKVHDEFVKFLADLTASQKAHCKTPIVDPYSLSSCNSFITGMQNLMSGESLSFTTRDQKRPPVAGVPSAPIEVMLRATYSLKPAPPPMETLCIVAALGRFQGTCTDDTLPSTTVSLSRLAAEFKLGSLSPNLGNIQIQTRVAPPGPGEPAAQDLPREVTTKQLQAVAVSAFNIARTLKIVPAAANPDAKVDSLYSGILALYLIEDSGWPLPEVTLGPMMPGSTHYQLTIKNLHLVEGAAVVLNQGKDLKVVPESQPIVDERVRVTSCEVEKRMFAALATLVGTIPTNARAWAVARTMGLDSQVTGTVVPTWAPRIAGKKYLGCPAAALVTQTATQNYRLDLSGAHRWVIGSINGTFNAGISANAHELISGDGQLTESHVLSRFETTSLSVHGGPEVQTADLSLTLQTNTGSINYGFVLDSSFRRDQNQRFGYLAGPKFVQEEYGPVPKLFTEFTRPVAGHAFSADVRLDVPFQFHHVLVVPPAAHPLFPARGWVNGFAPSISLLGGYDFAHSATPEKPGRGVGKVFVSMRGDAFSALRAAGSDFEFNRYTINGQAEVFWGPGSPQDFVIRYNRGLSASSSNTPLFELPQLGGVDNIRGIETGEYVGRGIAFDQTELGVNAESASRWLRKREPSLAKAAAENAAKLPGAAGSGNAPPEQHQPLLSSLGIDSIFVTGLYDRAKITSITSATSLFDLQHSFHGAGIKVEIRGLRAANKRVNLGLIYALSPNSVLHTKGTFTTSASIDF